MTFMKAATPPIPIPKTAQHSTAPEKDVTNRPGIGRAEYNIYCPENYQTKAGGPYGHQYSAANKEILFSNSGEEEVCDERADDSEYKQCEERDDWSNVPSTKICN